MFHRNSFSPISFNSYSWKLNTDALVYIPSKYIKDTASYGNFITDVKYGIVVFRSYTTLNR